MTPAKISDLQQLWTALTDLQEQAARCTTAAVTIGMEVIPYERCDGARVRVTFLSDKTGGHTITEPIDMVEEIESAAERMRAHGEGFLESQPKPAAQVNAATLGWGVKADQIKGPALWGARAIADMRGRTPILDILWDRQDAAGSPDAMTALHARLNGNDANKLAGAALQVFRDAFAAGTIEQDTDDKIEVVVLAGVEFHYRTAGGYCYITAKLTDLPDTPGARPKARKVRKAVR